MATSSNPIGVTFKFEIINKMLQFRIYIDGYTDPVNYLPVPEKDIDYLISLDGGLKWEFDFGPRGQAKAALTFKNQSQEHYYTPELVQGAGGVEPTKLMFRAKWSGRSRTQYNPKIDNHPFNVAILLEQPGGGKLRVLVDPDVKNPPPIGQFVEPGSVPFSVEPA